MRQKLSDYVACFVRDLGVDQVFGVTGGAAAHFFDSLAKIDGVSYVCAMHEQGAAMMADGYARSSGNIGVAVGTSGPGATNMLTGAGCAYYDSVPLLLITGQVSTYRLRGDSGVRQMGFQEADTVDIFRPITKSAVLITDAKRIRHELERAVFIAKSGRPGPVLVDIPDNLQREIIDPDELEGFAPESGQAAPEPTAEHVAHCQSLLTAAERPVLIFGWGVRLAGAERQALELAERLGAPFVLTWAVLDMAAHSHPLYAGTFGTHGSRNGNFTVQNADLVLSIGCRMDTHHTAHPVSAFARRAKRVFVDIDKAELDRFAGIGLAVDLAVHSDAGTFVAAMLRQPTPPAQAYAPWVKRIGAWREAYGLDTLSPEPAGSVDPYYFFKTLSRLSPQGTHTYVDTGCALAWTMQAFDRQPGQRLFSAFNFTPMGYALPAAIGACFALGRAQVLSISGDGGLQMNIQELATAKRHGLPVKIILVNNAGYSMIRQTQDQWLDSRYEGSSVEGGLPDVDFEAVAAAYGFETVTVENNGQARQAIEKLLACPGPMLCNVRIHRDCRVAPQVKFGRPMEDAEPLMPREEFLAQMIVEPLPVSRTMEE
ncbi:thiamine pyrophosphate-binding protein [Humidesulfovibrio idahonensis]